MWLIGTTYGTYDLTNKEINPNNSVTHEFAELPVRHNEEELKLELSPLFSKDCFLLETYRNPWSEMRFGKILENLSENNTFMSRGTTSYHSSLRPGWIRYAFVDGQTSTTINICRARSRGWGRARWKSG